MMRLFGVVGRHSFCTFVRSNIVKARGANKYTLDATVYKLW